MIQMKQLETTEYKIGDYVFYVRPFPAFTAAKIGADLTKIIVPLMSAILPLFGGIDEDKTLADIDAAEAGSAIGKAFSDLSTDEFEGLLKKLLIGNENVSVCGPFTEGATKPLSMDLANEIFCGEVQDMFVLCFYVISLNYKGFFKNLGSRFGNLIEGLRGQESTNTASLT